MLRSRLNAIKGKILNFKTRGASRSIAILASGSVLAHLVTVLAMPINTRLYTPQDFTVLSIFTSIVGILAPVACLRFDAAIVLPDSKSEAAELFCLSILGAFAVSLILCCLIYVAPENIYIILNVSKLKPYAWMIAPAIFITGTYLAMQAWYIRSKEFGAIAQSRATQSVTAAGTQIGMGYFGYTPAGLILGFALNYGIGSIFLLGGVIKRDLTTMKSITISGLKKTAILFKHFPKYSIWEGLANGLSNSAPLIIIATLAEGPEAGYLTLSLFALQAPLAVLGNAVGQVYLSGAPQAYREGELNQYTLKTLRGLIKAGTGPLLFAGLVSPLLFSAIFGAAWERSGHLVAWMAPWFYLQFLSSPICNALHVTRNQKLMMNFHILGVILRVGAVTLAGLYATALISEVWAITGWIFYAAYLAAILHVVGIPFNALLVELSNTKRQIGAFALFSAVVIAVAYYIKM